MEFLSAANEVIVLITGLLGLIGTGIGTYFAIKNWLSVFKNKSAQEAWQMIMEIADAAMTEAEKSNKTGIDKKAMVIQTVSAATKAAGIDMSLFLEQLSDYIDQTITFVNKMK